MRVAVSTASVRVVASTFACLSVLFAGLPLSPVSAQPRLEEPAQAEDVGSRKKPEELKWAVTLYAGVFSTEHLYEVLTLSANYEQSYVGVAALSWQFFRLGEHIRLEVEGQVAKHFGEQHHWELNALVIGRWVTFPWKAYLDTTFAVGEGISYATEVPALEREDGASQWLNYLLFKVTFALPKYPEWAIVGRIHHRSGFFGALVRTSWRPGSSIDSEGSEEPPRAAFLASATRLWSGPFASQNESVVQDLVGRRTQQHYQTDES
jgi:hypothetical protein